MVYDTQMPILNGFMNQLIIGGAHIVPSSKLTVRPCHDSGKISETTKNGRMFRVELLIYQRGNMNQVPYLQVNKCQLVRTKYLPHDIFVSSHIPSASKCQ